MAHLLTPAEAAELLHMDARTLVAWARRGYVPSHPLGEGKRRLWRFFEGELLIWIEAQKGGKRRAEVMGDLEQQVRFKEMKAKADEEFAKQKKQRLFERGLRGQVWTNKKEEAMAPQAWPQLHGPGFKALMSGDNRPAEKLARGRTKGMEKTDLDWAKQMNEEQREKNGELRRNDRSREV